MKKIEYLYPEVTNLYGDIFNIKYLKASMKDVEIIETPLTEKPKFIDEDIDLVYMGSMSEKTQELVIEKLKPYKIMIKEKIENNKIFLLTGNALEVMGQYIENEDGSKIEGLGITDLYAKRDMMHRYNTLFLGEFNDFKIVGNKATFSFSYGDNSENYLFKSIKGCGINKQSNLEGIRIKNFFATYLIGPLLIVSPNFTKYLITLMGEQPTLMYEKEAEECYKQRIIEFENNNTNFEQ